MVAVDNPAIQIVEIGGGKTAAGELNHGAQVRRNNGQGFQNHPGGIDTRATQAIDHAQALGGFDVALTGSSSYFLAQISR